MASSNKWSTGQVITTVILFMVSALSVAAAFLKSNEAAEKQTTLEQREKELSETKSAQTKADGRVQNLTQLLGDPGDAPREIGKAGDEDATTLVGSISQKIGVLAETIKKANPAATDLGAPSVSQALTRADQELARLSQEQAKSKLELAQLYEELKGLKDVYQKSVDQHQQARTEAEKLRQDAQDSKETAIAAKDQEINKLTADVQEQRQAVQQMTQELTKATQDFDRRYRALESRNNELLARFDRETKKSMERADGRIDSVDRDLNRVYINLGSSDGLREGVTFSVYRQANNGVARGQQDIKGAIEVSKIIGPHQAEAIIRDTARSEPMIPGDPIYTPLWQPGRRERFAFVGLIDLDNDGISDRDVLHEIIEANNGMIVDEVDDKGIRKPENGAIDVHTKFLIVGEIPDFTESKPDDQEGHRKIGTVHQKMLQEAREAGVRAESLGNFLNYIGYAPQRRIYRPGQTRSWNLRQGSRSPSAMPSDSKPPVSTGTTSKLYEEKTK